MSAEHDRYSVWAGAYILGALEADERIEYQQHLATCDRCQLDVKAFSAIPGLLSHLDADELDISAASSRVAELAIARVEHDYAQVQSSKRRWRAAALIAIAAALVMALLMAISSLAGVGSGSGGQGIALDISTSGPTGTVVIEHRVWGTQIELKLDNLPPRDLYQLWAVAADGSRQIAATWTATPAGRANITGAAATPTSDLAEIVVTSADFEDRLLAAD